MKEITRINHVGLRVSNLEVTREFYEKLGFKETGPIYEDAGLPHIDMVLEL